MQDNVKLEVLDWGGSVRWTETLPLSDCLARNRCYTQNPSMSSIAC